MKRSTRKFIQPVEDPAYKKLVRIARAKGITLQMLIRAVAIPEWLATQKKVKRKR